MIRRRILQVTAIPLTAARFLLPLAHALAEAGHEVHFATGPGPEQATLLKAGFRVHTVPFDRRIASPVNVRCLMAMAALQWRGAFDCVHGHTPIAGLVARIGARLAGAPVVLYTLHGSVWGGRSSAARTRLFSLAERLGAQFTDHVFVLNDSDATYLRTRGYFPADAITNLGVGGSGIDLRRFRRDAVGASARREVRAELGIPVDAPVIGFLGRLVREKGVLDLAHAFVEVQRRIPEAHLLFAGGSVGGEWDAVSAEEIAASLSAHPAAQRQTRVTGFREDVPRLLAAMDVVVLPSWREGFGMALAEAGAMGLPVVATRTPGGMQAVVHGENGFLTPLRAPQALADAIVTILGQPELARRMGQRGVEMAASRFDQRISIEKQLAVYREFLG